MQALEGFVKFREVPLTAVPAPRNLLAADSSSSSPNVVVCLLLFVYQVEKLLAYCLQTYF